jgi:hypothetical protein
MTLVFFAPQYAYDFRHIDEAKAWIGGYREAYDECEAFHEWRGSKSEPELAIGLGPSGLLSEDGGEADLVELERLIQQCLERHRRNRLRQPSGAVVTNRIDKIEEWMPDTR